MGEAKVSCVKPAKGPLAVPAPAGAEPPTTPPAEGRAAMVRVGQPAPDFEANAFVNGAFDNVKLSSFRGQWVSLCFYPGDFTFV